MVKSAYLREPITPTQQIARITHPSDAKKRLLAMIAYFDESGKPDDNPVVSLAALVAYDRKWFRFDTNWNKILTENKVPIHKDFNRPYMHMKDFVPRNPPYNKWPEKKRIKFCTSLAKTIKDTILLGVCHTLAVKDWNEVIVPTLNNPYKKKRAWYIFLLQAIMVDIAAYMPHIASGRIACVFDQNHEVSYAAKMHYAGLKKARGWEHIFGAESYDRSPNLPGLQAADMLAHVSRSVVKNRIIEGDSDHSNKLFENMTSKKQITVGRCTREDLIKFHTDWMNALAYREAMEKYEDHAL